MKGVILAGGFGTRLKPCTLCFNKHLLPVYDKPMIYYPILALKDCGIDDICLVIGGESPGDFITILGNGEDFGVRITYLYQPRPGGIAEAVGLCESFVGGYKFVVMLGDNLFLGSLRGFTDGFEESSRDCGIVITEAESLSDYGVPEFDKTGKLTRIIEKPVKPPSKYAVTGAYAYTPAVFSEIRRLQPSGRGELEISDAHTRMISKGSIYVHEFTGQWFDCGGSFDRLFQSSAAVKEYVAA